MTTRGGRAVLACVLGALALPAGAAASPCTPGPSVDPRVPTWTHVNGFALGSRVSTVGEVDAYLTAVGRASARVRTGRAGRSAGGREILYAVVGTPADVAPRRLHAVAARVRALRSGTASAAVAARVAAGDPGFVYVAGGVHGSEPSGTDADMRLLYDLAARRDCATDRRLHALDTFLIPMQNPDGRAADRRTNDAGFDLNRDWFAQTQPETRGRLALLETYPPLLYVDQHEQDGTAFFVPPDADPVHHEISTQALHAIDEVIGPAVRRALTAHGTTVTSDATYDLFFMGYGDTVPTTLFGAAGMTFEAGDQTPYPERVAEHYVAASAALATTAHDKVALLTAWAAQWRTARGQGARGVLAPNRVVVPSDAVRRHVPSARVYGYVLRTDVHSADAAALADRLTSVGVTVDRLAAPVTVPALHAYGVPGAAAATLPAGTFYVPLAQGAKHWVEAMLGEDPYVPFPYFYDVSSWSNPLLMGLTGGALRTPLPSGTPLRRVAAGRAGAAAALPAAAAYAFASGSEGSAELATALLARGIAVRRVPGAGTFVVGADAGAATLSTLAATRRVPVAALTAVPAGTVALHAPKVAMLAGPGEDPTASLSAAWATDVLEQRLGVTVDRLGDADLAAGRLGTDGDTALVVADGTTPDGGLSPAGLAGVAAWVRGGGELVAWRGQGLDVAMAAGLTAVRQRPAPALTVAGVALRMALDTTDPVAWGEDPFSFAFDDADPILNPGTAHVAGSYPAGAGFFVSGYATGTAALRGSAAITDETAGAGRVVLFAFDPSFRAYVEGTERLLANALLAPPAR